MPIRTGLSCKEVYGILFEDAEKVINISVVHGEIGRI